MKLRNSIIARMEEQGFTNITIDDDYNSIGYGDLVFYAMSFTDPKGQKLTGRAYHHLNMGPGEEYSIYVENVEGNEDVEWEGEPRVFMTL